MYRTYSRDKVTEIIPTINEAFPEVNLVPVNVVVTTQPANDATIGEAEGIITGTMFPIILMSYS